MRVLLAFTIVTGCLTAGLPPAVHGEGATVADHQPLRRQLRLPIAPSAPGLESPAQAPAGQLPASRAAVVRVRVTDETAGAIVGAVVVVTQPGRPDERTTTGPAGEASVAAVPGSAEIRVEATGFETRTLGLERLRPGSNRVDVRLRIAGVSLTVQVSRDARETWLDPRGNAFARVLTPDAIAQLPDDPDELERVLKEMAGPGAIIRVNGFGGSRLPPKGQIRQIRFSVNSFSAELHEVGLPIIDITTEPGGDRWRSSAAFTFRSPSLVARYPFSTGRSSEHVRRGGVSIDGPIWRQRTSMAASFDASAASNTQTYLASTPEGQLSGVSARPVERSLFTVELEHALTRSHTSRLVISRDRTTLDNLGVGGVNLPERAYGTVTRIDSFSVSDAGPLGRRLFNELRIQVARIDTRTKSSSGPAVDVLGAFGAGGAQTSQTRRAWEVEAADHVDLAAGRHGMRFGLLVQAGRYRSEDSGNQEGTFTFSGLDAYVRGTPLTYTRRIGHPMVEHTFYRAGWYVQDDIKAHRTLTVGAGIRHEVQSHVPGRLNLSPRIGATWAPVANGGVVVRGGAALVFDWLEPAVYEQALRVHGNRQFDLVVTNPGYPDPDQAAGATLLPPSRLQLGPGLRLPRVLHTSVALQRQFNLATTVTVTYTRQRASRLFRGRNLNAPQEDGRRPFPQWGNVMEIVSTARSALDRLDVTFGRAVIRNQKLSWQFAGTYSLGRIMNDTDGPFSVPAASRPGAEWGYAAGDVRHRVNVLMLANLPRGFRLLAMAGASSAPPYTVTTGFDGNGDTIVNDRPQGIGRNSERAAGQFDVTARIGWTVGFGRPPGGTPQVPNIRRLRTEAERDPMGAAGAAGPRAHRVQLEVFAQAYNLLNRVNPTGFRSVLTSPYYGRPTASLPPRRVDLGARIMF